MKTKLQKFLMRTKKSELSFEAHYVYSVLVYRTSYGKPASQKAIAKLTNLDRGETVSRAMKRLESIGLAKKQGRRWMALEPQDEARTWFFWEKEKGKEKQWFDSFAYHKINRVNPECDIKLTPRENVYYFLLKKFPGKPKSYMAAAVGCTTKTIGRIKARLTTKIRAANAARINFYKFGDVQKVQPVPVPAPVSIPVASLPTPAPAPVVQKSLAEKVKAEGEAIAAKMKADLCAQAQQVEVEMELKSDWDAPDPYLEIERNQTPEEKAKAEAVRREEWIQEEYQRLNKLWNSWKIPFDDQKEIIDLLWNIWRETGVDAIYETLLSGSLYRCSEEYWQKSKFEAKSNPRKYFKVSLINRLNQSYGTDRVGAA